MIILGSSSPRRRDILNMFNLSFKVVKPNVDEEKIKNMFEINCEKDCEKLVKSLSVAKLNAIKEEYPDDIILCADTLVFLNNAPLGKPKDRTDAINMLKKLAGNKHLVITGVSIYKNGEIQTFSTTSIVRFRKYDKTIEKAALKYVENGGSDGKAGSYGIQDYGAIFVEKIEGDFYNVVGLPIEAVYRILS
ncbi:MAG: Maf family protein [Ezakiella sp.]|nr:Maf family protein [Ezakiella sp.]MDD7472327.1 Maf family protein [Bacillota bacterium]MDY3923064.1 Maf family protein [Ezakiella sp.]